MTNKTIPNELYGRICLGDATRKYSRFGVFEQRGGKDLICIERVDNGEKSVPVYLPRTEYNEHLVNNHLSPGDVVRIRGEYDNEYLLADEIEVLSTSSKGKNTAFFDVSKQIRAIAKQKGGILRQLRADFESNGFLETSTPILLSHYEGGDATPFTVEDKKGKGYFLKETNELILRRLLSANVGKVYEIGKSFRNIGTNSNSLNEFTVVESAIPYSNLEGGIDFSEGLLKRMIQSVDSTSPLLKDWERIPFEQVFHDVTGKKYSPSGDYRQDREDLERVLNGMEGPAYLVGLPVALSPINKSNGTTLQESVLVLDNSVYCDICEFDVDKESVKKRLLEQEKRTGRINSSFLDFMDEGMVPGVGVAFGLERWMKYFTGINISELKSLGGVI